MTPDPGSLLPVALQAADIAADLMRTRRPASFTEKADRDLVSDVDLAIERAGPPAPAPATARHRVPRRGRRPRPATPARRLAVDPRPHRRHGQLRPRHPAVRDLARPAPRRPPGPGRHRCPVSGLRYHAAEGQAPTRATTAWPPPHRPVARRDRRDRRLRHRAAGRPQERDTASPPPSSSPPASTASGCSAPQPSTSPGSPPGAWTPASPSTTTLGHRRRCRSRPRGRRRRHRR